MAWNLHHRSSCLYVHQRVCSTLAEPNGLFWYHWINSVFSSFLSPIIPVIFIFISTLLFAGDHRCGGNHLSLLRHICGACLAHSIIFYILKMVHLPIFYFLGVLPSHDVQGKEQQHQAKIQSRFSSMFVIFMLSFDHFLNRWPGVLCRCPKMTNSFLKNSLKIPVSVHVSCKNKMQCWRRQLKLIRSPIWIWLISSLFIIWRVVVKFKNGWVLYERCQYTVENVWLRKLS